MGLSAVCDCGISWSYSLTILDSLRLGIRYSDAGIATRSYVTLYEGCTRIPRKG